MDQTAYRHAPYDIGVEQALLGAILVDNSAMERASAIIKPEHFYDPLHGRVLDVMSQLIASGVNVTPLTLHATMKSDPGVIETGGQSYMDALRAAAPALPNIENYSRIVLDHFVRRSLIRVGEDLVNTAYDAPTEVKSTQMIDGALDGINIIAEQARKLSPQEPYCLSLAEWLARDLPPADDLLGELLSTTSRFMLIAASGLGKTNFAMAKAFAMAAGQDFLHWRGGRPCRVLYVDGEMSKRQMTTRLADAVRRFGGKPETLSILSRADVEDMPPLNTPAGQAYIDAKIKELGGVDFIFFDNVQALLVGDMKEEEAWQNTLPWIKRLTKRQIGQCWVHHTGWDKTRAYGTSTREWQMDTVAVMEAVEGSGCDIAFTLTFTKARERGPYNRADFETVVVTLADDQWAVEDGKASKKGDALTKAEHGWIDDIVDLFAAPGATKPVVPSPCMPTVQALTREQVRQGLRHKGRFMADPGEALTRADRTKLSTALNALKSKKKIGMTEQYIWLLET